MVICLRFPYFAPSVEQRDDAALQHKPLVIGGQAWQPGHVYAMSGPAVQQGVRLDMPLRQAHLYCPQANFIPSAHTHYETVAQTIGDQLQAFTDQLEPQTTRPALIYYLKSDCLHEKSRIQHAQAAGRTIRSQLGLPPAIGIADNKFTAYLSAKRTHSSHLTHIASAEKRAFLASYSLSALALPPKLQVRLKLFGLHTLGDLAALPTGDIAQQFGTLGVSLHRLARGHDPRPIQPRPQPQQQQWRMVWDDAVDNLQTLEYVLLQAANELAAKLKAQQLCTTALQLHLEFDGGDQRHVQRQLPIRHSACRRVASALLCAAGAK